MKKIFQLGYLTDTQIQVKEEDDVIDEQLLQKSTKITKKKQKFIPSLIIQKQNRQQNEINYSQILDGGRIKTKNIPKMFGNYLYQYGQRISKFQIKQLPYAFQKFIYKKQQSKQSKYNIADFQELCYDSTSQKLFQQFLEKDLILDLIHSNKVPDPTQYIGIIEFYQAASMDPEQLTCNRIQNY